ncbi:MAG TPA: hypothetical protein GXX26_09070 [Clostridiaceae bacterium]|jgi:hypothetical protein|nr:hypothetical protein [Clostridiaceae bacterium]
MRNNTSKYIVGAVLVIFGILAIFGDIGFLTFSWVFKLTWPTIIIMISLFFFLGYLSKKPQGAGFLVPAGTLFTIGATLLIGEMFPFMYEFIWPAFIASPAVGLLLLYLLGEKSPGLLVPIGILMTITATCFFSELLNLWGVLWPGFIMAPAVGLFLLYIAENNRRSGLLVPIFILSGISLVFFSIFALGYLGRYFKYIAGGVLILAGIGTILKKPIPRDFNDNRH